MRAFPAGAAAAAILSVALSSEQAPNFSGTWTAATDVPRRLPAAPSPVMGPRFAIAHEGGALTLTRPTRDDSLAVRFPLDGSRASYRIPGRLCEGEVQFVETATIENGALVLTVVGRRAAGSAVETPLSIKRLMRPDGDALVVEATMVQSGQSRQVATVYKRTSDPIPPPKPAAVISGPPATIAQVEWIGGVWSGPNGAVTVEERWTPPASGGMIGVGRTLRGTALASFEFLCIAERNGTLVYAAMPDARFPATFFTATAVTADSVTFENPGHDFPKLIRYTRRADGALETAISAGGTSKPTTFVLPRQK
jgi:hypothetical protein